MNLDRILRSLCVASCVLASETTSADDYRLDPSPTFEQGTAHIPMEFAEPEDPTVCKTYLANLSYYARRNTPMSCERPIAPHLKKVIEEVQWENLDPYVHEGLFRSIIAMASLGRDKTQAAFEWRVQQLRKGELVFRRAQLSLSGYFDSADHTPKTTPERFEIVQYGVNVVDTKNPAEVWRCKPQRGGPPHDFGDLNLYLVSEDLKRLHGYLNDYMRNGNTGHYLRLVNGRPYVEQVLSNGNSVLMQVRTALPVGLESVCMYLFKRSPT
jgi:hypothetical protein